MLRRCIHGQGQVAAIVDDERDAEIQCDFSQKQRLSIGLLHRGRLIPILK